MKKGFLKMLMLVMLLIIAFPSNLVMASSGHGTLVSVVGSGEEATNIKVTFSPDNVEMTKNTLEKVVSDFLLKIGDYAHDYLTQTLKEEITIDRIVYNKVIILNSNFFENGSNPAISGVSRVVRTAINTWFDIFQGIAVVVIMMVVIVAGIKTMMGTAQGKAEAYESIKKVIVAAALVFLFPFVMKYAFEINEAIINMIYNGIYNNISNTSVGIALSPISDLTMDQLEPRSPQYVSGAGLRISAGSEEATQMYINKLYQNAAKGDLMRIMRAFAGATLRLMYVIIWYILLIQTYIMVIIYLKRFVTIAFLIAIYPIVITGYVTEGMFGASHNAFNQWCNRFFSNVFLQSLHGVIYGVISGILIDQVRREMLSSGQKINWILMIVATSFLFSGEKILTRFWKAAMDTGGERKGIKSLLGKPKMIMGKIGGAFKG